MFTRFVSRRVVSVLVGVGVAASAFAGGGACVIIIQCGALRSKAAELREFPSDALRPKAAELEALEGEICDLGPHIAEYLSPAEKEELWRRAQAAWDFGRKLQAFMDDWKAQKEDDKRKLAADIQSFTDDQAAWFSALAWKYKDKG